MTRFDGVPLTRGGWTFFLPDYDARYSEELRERLIDSAFAAIDGTLSTRVRRSRHAETWFEHFDQVGGLAAYFKVLDPIRGLNRVRWIFRRRRAAHVASVSEHLRADAVGVPEILLLGAERRGGREIIVTARVEGFSVARHLRRAKLASRRVVLRALGAEVARLHRAGYIHGDLSPFNIFVTGLEPPQFVFIDHERTRRTILSRFARPRMRNLVQLGHLELFGITNTDRMRVWCGYSATFSVRRRRVERRRIAAMLRDRIAQDRKGGVADRVASSLGPRREASGS
ncbi:MAG TPA: lipopolysaccharide kinase InaA family protein [Candidatus Binatus sp.]|uniref:lipopolysaccharide kinase InaA family protein n=1 Tax=Candidatus Binatus sp. TaxID=2811406 RepID=UPI002B48A30E|nr:lipopolysaccharide kinase InaA family protein [Candidatus Binatus sp.]HKN14140.1 lipopolysaccharide kinase InaA family protein [Candidatus Binatus sp.]